ncbi:MAG: SDR family oxidoreductase [bacterium]
MPTRARPKRSSGDHAPTTLITGATGFLGRNLLYRLLEADETSRYALLVRGSETSSPRKRLQRLLVGKYGDERTAELTKRIDLVMGDVSWEHFGLDDRSYEALAANTHRIIHAAASVAFALPLEQARTINVGGTKHILDFASACGKHGDFERLDYIGTAFVAGDRAGTVLEDELDCGQHFHNTYEQTKFEAEKLVREHWKDLPITIHRPSIVVGESKTGKTSSFNVLYFPLKIYARGLWRWIPGSPSTEVDIVPIDYVCDAVLGLSRDPSTLGRCFHVTSSDHSTTIGRAAEMASHYFAQKPVRFFPPSFYMNVIHRSVVVGTLPFPRLHDTLINKGSLYLPYFLMNFHFDDRNARSVLEPHGIRAPKAEEYFAQIFQYAIDTEWGKKLPDRGD